MAKQLRQYPDIRLWLTGSPAERKWLEEYAAKLLQQRNVSNLCGKFMLDQLSSFIKGADGLIASGTGPPPHMAAADRPAHVRFVSTYSANSPRPLSAVRSPCASTGAAGELP